jgi:hypothetical protein
MRDHTDLSTFNSIHLRDTLITLPSKKEIPSMDIHQHTNQTRN